MRLQVLILAAVVTLAYGHSACPALWTHFKGTCYRLFPDRLRREDAATTCGQFAPCSGEGLGQLAKITDAQTNSFLKLYASTFGSTNPAGFDVWTGATDALLEGRWTWQDGLPLATTFWLQGQPDNGARSGQPENCGVLNSVTGQWSDVFCGTMQPYICEMRGEIERQPMFPGVRPGFPGQGGFPGQNPGQGGFPGQNPNTPFNPNNPNNPRGNPNNPNNPNTPGFPRTPGQPI